MSDARIVDRGYRRYDGPRLGEAAILRSLTVHSLRRVLGLRRPARAKALPVLVIAIAFFPAIIIVGIAAFVGDAFDGGADLPSYAGYSGFVITAILVFVTFVAPEALCPDRRSRLLGQYLAAPVSRAGYVLAKAISVYSVLLLVTLGPQLLLLVALTLEDAGPAGVDGFFATLGRIVASGLVLSLFLGTLALAASSITDRKAFASVGFLVFTLVTSVAAGILYDDGDGITWAGVLSVTGLPLETVFRIFDVPAHCPRRGPCNDELLYPELSTVAVAGAALLWFATAAAVVWARYREVEAS
jgi:ABC-2 type transport system permease protein